MFRFPLRTPELLLALVGLICLSAQAQKPSAKQPKAQSKNPASRPPTPKLKAPLTPRPTPTPTVPPMSFGPPVEGYLPFDTVDLQFGEFEGKAAYSLFLPDANNQSALVIAERRGGKSFVRSFPPQNVQREKQWEMSNYPNARVVYSAQFSPDGRYVLFGARQLSIPPEPWRWVLDTQTNEVTVAGHFEAQFYDVMSWSPDSKYFLHVMWGNSDGYPFDPFARYYGPMNLSLCDWRTGKSQVVVTGDTLRGPWSWISPETLVYGLLPLGQSDELRGLNNNIQSQILSAQFNRTPIPPSVAQLQQRSRTLQPQLFLYSTKTRQTKKLPMDGFRPVASPDGKRLAFFASQDPKRPVALPEHWEDSPSGLTLVAANLDGSQSVPLHTFASFYPSIIWEKDNRHLITIENTTGKRAHIRRWDTQKGGFESLAMLPAEVWGWVTPSSGNENTPLRLSQDGKHLFFKVAKSVGKSKNTHFYLSNQAIHALNLETREISLVVKAGSGVETLDWVETIPPEKDVENAALSAR